MKSAPHHNKKACKFDQFGSNNYAYFWTLFALSLVYKAPKYNHCDQNVQSQLLTPESRVAQQVQGDPCNNKTNHQPW